MFVHGPRPIAFRCAVLCRMIGNGHIVHDGQLTCRKVNIFPAEPNQLTASHPRGGKKRWKIWLMK